MQISCQNNLSFRGYDARPLSYLIIRNASKVNLRPAARQLQTIARKNGFDVILEGEKVIDKIPNDEHKYNINTKRLDYWLQDNIHFMKDKILAIDTYHNDTNINRYFGLPLKKIDYDDFIKGGNVFFIKHKGKNKLLLGSYEDIQKAEKLFKNKNIIQIPQADYHLDLFIKPLKNGVVLVADDNLTLAIMKKAAGKLKLLAEQNEGNSKYFESLELLNERISKMQSAHDNTVYNNTEEVIETLQNNGFTAVRVPGRVYYNPEEMYYDDSHPAFHFSNKLNYMNSIVHEKENGELVYITNKSKLCEKLGLNPETAKRIGLDMESNFKNAVKDYIPKRNIYFVSGGENFDENIQFFLEAKNGGIHCLTCEVPKGFRNQKKAEPFDKLQRLKPFKYPKETFLQEAERLWKKKFKSYSDK